MFSFKSPPLTVIQDLMTFCIDASVNDIGLLHGRSLGDHHHPQECLRDSCEELENGTIWTGRLRPDGRRWRRREPPPDGEADETSDHDIAVT